MIIEHSAVSVLIPRSFSIRPNCCTKSHDIIVDQQIDMNCQVASDSFYEQFNDFCRMLEQEHSSSLSTSDRLPRSGQLARGFAEKIILCPTAESARTCIRRDLAGALSFLLAAEGVQQRLAKGDCHFANESPDHQTIFYILAGAVHDYLESMRSLAVLTPA